MNRKRFDTKAEAVSLPHPPVPARHPPGVGLFPTGWLPAALAHLAWQQWRYRPAFEQAQAVVRPSLPERDLLAVWN